MIPPLSTAANASTAQTGALDGAHNDATMASDTDLSPTNTSNDSNCKGQLRPPPLTLRAFTTIPSCNCGESLCGYDCHFLQQEIKDFEAAAARGAHRRSRPRHDSTGSACSEDQQHLQNDDGGIADLERRFQRHFSSGAVSTGFDGTCVGDILSAPPSDADVLPPARMCMRRTKSCGVHSAEFDQEQLQRRHNAYRLRIDYRDEALRERCEQNTHALLQRGVSDSSDATSTTTILARKALRYRRILERMEGVDVMDPSLDVSKCLGVCWQRVGSPK
ncbi:hypothetical protein Gpo141_00014176 [Globisporangium polare]